MFITAETKVGDTIQEEESGKTALVMWIGKFLHTQDTLLIVSPRDEEDDPEMICLNSIVIPEGADINTEFEDDWIVDSSMFSVYSSKDLIVDYITAMLAVKYYNKLTSKLITRIQDREHSTDSKS